MSSFGQPVRCCIAQVAIIVCGVLLIAKAHKVMRGLWAGSDWHANNTQLAIHLRDYGAFLLLVPLLWILAATYFYDPVARTPKIMQSLGVFITVGLCVLLLFGLITCFRTPMIISVPR